MRFFVVLGIIIFQGLFSVSETISHRTLHAADDVFRAGAAAIDLTPGDGVSLNGPISKPGPVRGIHDRLHSRAIVMQLGETTFAICVNDLCMADREVIDNAKKIVEKQIGIPPHQQLISSTHTHAAPRVSRISTRQADEDYRVFAAKTMAKAIITAHENLAPAKMAVEQFELPDAIACRRFLCEPGSVNVNPFGVGGERIKSVAGRSSAVIRPAGPTDPEFSVLSLQHLDGTPLAVLGNFSVHYCGGYAGGQVSADYFGSYARKLEESLTTKNNHPKFVGIMSNGTSGDTGSFTNREKKKYAPWERMQHWGNLLAESSLANLENAGYKIPQRLNVSSSELKLKVRKPSPERIAWAKELLSDPKAKGPHRWSRVYANETLHLADYPDETSLMLQAIQIGDTLITSCPCEVFAGTGVKIKEGAPFKKSFTIELANGYSGYLPSEEQHNLGGYETWPARSSHLEVKAEEKIRLELLLLQDTATDPSL